MTQVLEVVKVKSGEASLAGQKFKTVRALSKQLNVHDVVIVLETAGTKATGISTPVGYRTVTKTEAGEIETSRPTTLEKLEA